MSKSEGMRLVVVMAVLGLAGVCAGAAPQQHGPRTRSSGELVKAAETALQHGFDAKLPPHISTLLGLTREQECPVKQGVLRGEHRIQGLDVPVANHNDVVLFVVDEATGDQDYYLTSRSGTLRKVLAVRQGVGRVVRPSKQDLEAFQREKQVWEKRAEPMAARK